MQPCSSCNGGTHQRSTTDGNRLPTTTSPPSASISKKLGILCRKWDQLIHADKHGFLVVPAEDEDRLLEASVFMDSNECRTVIPAARSTAGKSKREILEALTEGRRKFRENVEAKFGGKGEW